MSEIQGLEEREASEAVQKDRGGRRTCCATRGHCKGPENQIMVKEVDEKGQSGKRGLGIEFVEDSPFSLVCFVRASNVCAVEAPVAFIISNLLS